MPTRKRMLPMASRSRSKKRTMPKRRKKTPLGRSFVSVGGVGMEGDGYEGEAFPLTTAAEGYAYLCFGVLVVNLRGPVVVVWRTLHI